MQYITLMLLTCKQTTWHGEVWPEHNPMMWSGHRREDGKGKGESVKFKLINIIINIRYAWLDEANKQTMML